MVALLPKACICEGIPPSVYNRGYAATRERAMGRFQGAVGSSWPQLKRVAVLSYPQVSFAQKSLDDSVPHAQRRAAQHLKLDRL